MSVSAPCHVCGRADVSHTCERCGKLVCGEHFEEEYGMCVECVVDVGVGETPERIPNGEDKPDGVDTYRF